MVKQWMNWCRLCAREDSSNTHRNIFLDDEKGLGLSKILNRCFSININHFNNWPHMICIHCYFLAKSIINLAERTSKVHAMFAELLDGDDNLDANKIKVRYELNKFSDVNFDLKAPMASTTVNALEVPDIPIEMTEQMVDVDELQYIDSDVLSTSAIKTEEKDKDYKIPTAHEESSDEDDSLKSEVFSDDLSPDEKQAKPGKTIKIHKNRWTRRVQTEPIKCEKCPKSFYRVQYHRRHMEKAHGIILEIMEPTKPPDYICEECGKKCKTYWKLRDHMITHTSERPLKCGHCEKLFKNKQTLKTHEDTHNENNYICVVCGLKLNTRITLRRHMVVHSDKKQHKCDFCGNEYKRAKALKSHLILHTGLKPYTCDFCDRTFANGSNCRSHKKKAHPVELAAMEASGKNSIAADIPKLVDLRAVSKAKNAESKNKNEPKVSNYVNSENKTNIDESLKSLINTETTNYQPMDFDQGILGSMLTS